MVSPVRVKGTEILTGVLEATVRDPSRSGPGTKLTCGLSHPRKRRRRQATRPHFHACKASPGRDMELTCLNSAPAASSVTTTSPFADASAGYGEAISAY